MHKLIHIHIKIDVFAIHKFITQLLFTKYKLIVHIKFPFKK